MIAAAGTAAAVMWFDRLFEERAARVVPSLTRALRARSVLAILAHPDDEVLIAGALGDAARRPGVVVRTLTLTRGEAGFSDPPICRREDLPAIRVAEALRYGFILGLDEQEIWEYPDGGLAEADRGELVGRIAGAIRSWGPDLVITFDPEGGYSGHADHKAVGALATEAFRVTGGDPDGLDPEASGRSRHLAYVVAPRRMLRFSGDPAMVHVAEVQPAPSLAAPADRRLRAAGWEIHASQDLRGTYGMPPWILYRFYDEEHFVLAAREVVEAASRHVFSEHQHQQGGR